MLSLRYSALLGVSHIGGGRRIGDVSEGHVRRVETSVKALLQDIAEHQSRYNLDIYGDIWEVAGRLSVLICTLTLAAGL